MPARPRTLGRATQARPAGAALAAVLAGALSLALAPGPLAAQPDEPATPEAAAPAAGAPATPETTLADLSARRSAAWVAVGVAAAFATTSAVLALSAESRESDIEYLIEFRGAGSGMPSRFARPVRERYDELAREGEQLSFYSWATLGLASAAALAAVTLFVMDDAPASPGETPETPAGDPAGDAAASARLAPALLPGGMGVTLDWEF